MSLLKMKRIAALASIFTISNSFCSAHNQHQQEYPFIETVTYNANNPIEDRLAYGRLKSIDGFTASVFDGHGGDLTVLYLLHSLNMPASISMIF
jgi:hypothetical protein